MGDLLHFPPPKAEAEVEEARLEEHDVVVGLLEESLSTPGATQLLVCKERGQVLGIPDEAWKWWEQQDQLAPGNYVIINISHDFLFPLSLGARRFSQKLSFQGQYRPVVVDYDAVVAIGKEPAE